MNLSTSKRRRARWVAAGIALGISCIAPTHASDVAAENYPNKPVRIIVPYPVGGFNDTLGRLAANKLGVRWKQPVIVENKPGAQTIIGTQAAATSKPDGYTLLVVQIPLSTNLWLYKSLPYDTLKDFQPVILAGKSPMMLLTHANSEYKSLADVLAAAKKNPGALNYGSSGPGSSQHLGMKLFERQSETSMNQVPYRGSTPLLTDLAGGQLDVAVDLLPHALPFIESGKIRPLAMGTHQRSPLMPELPTAAELGVQGYEVFGWHGFVVPAGTPADVVARINHDLNEIFNEPDVQQMFYRQGVSPDGGTPEQFEAFIKEQIALWEPIIKENNISAE